jgi:phosphoglycolate phosphatase-like HAD superfamily hydrolase
MAGDSTWHCEAARRAGLDTVAVLTGGFREGELREAGASHVFRSLRDLRAGIRSTPLA